MLLLTDHPLPIAFKDTCVCIIHYYLYFVSKFSVILSVSIIVRSAPILQCMQESYYLKTNQLYFSVFLEPVYTIYTRVQGSYRRGQGVEPKYIPL